MIGGVLQPAEVAVAEPRSAAAATAARGLAGREILALDGVRGVAILLVVWCHLGVPPVSMDLSAVNTFAYSGVLLFFVLSGLLLFLPYARALINAAPWPSWRRFYGRRVRRILPVYAAAVVVSLAINVRHSGGFAVLVRQHGLSLILMGTLLHDLTANAWNFVSGLDAPLWSLATEWQFYLVLPPIALGLRRLASTRPGRWGAVLGVIAFLIAGLDRWSGRTRRHDPGAYGLAVVRSYLPFAGHARQILAHVRPWHARCACLRVGHRGRPAFAGAGVTDRPCRNRCRSRDPCARLRVGIGRAALSVRRGFARMGAGNTRRLDLEHRGEWTLALGYTGLIVGALLGPRLLCSAWSWRPLRFLGLISCSIYIWHYPLLARLHQMQLPIVGAYPLYIGVTVPLLVFVGWASYRLLERPFLTARKAS